MSIINLVYEAPNISATAISLDKSSISLATVGQTEQLIATLTPADSTSTVTWSSSNTSIATVSDSGLVTCVTPGSCTITATTDNGLSASCSVSLPNYLCFTANTAGSTIKLIDHNTTLVSPSFETSIDGETWSAYTMEDVITLTNVGDKVYRRNASDITNRLGTSDSKYHYFQMTGSIAVSGDLGYMLNKNNTDTIVGNYALTYLFRNCPITSCPIINFANATDGCFYGLFYYCASLTTLPKLNATTLGTFSYKDMFNGCSSIKLSTTQDSNYTQEYKIPFTGTGTGVSSSLSDMFTSTGGSFKGSPTINTTYYTSNTVV